MESALTTGKEYLEKYGSCEAFKEQVDFVKPHVARIEKDLPRAKEGALLKPHFDKFDGGMKSGNADDVLSAGKEILNVRKEDMNIAFAMALIAREKSTPENKFKYADEGIRLSNLVATRLKGGWEFDRKYVEGPKKGSPYVGVGNYNRDNRDAAVNELLFNAAFLSFYGKKDYKTALPAYYELSQSPLSKDDPRIYGAIGEYYVAEGGPIGEEIAKLIDEQKKATDEAVKTELDTKIKGRIAMFNGYLERAIDAFGRAHSVAKPGPYKDGLYKQLGVLYKRRTDKDTGMDAFVSGMLAKPFPNPTSPVTPVADPEPTTTTTTTSAPAAGTPTKPLSTSAPTKATVAKKAGQQ
jgi:tetratricopeptide (TPR) repeat protein